MAKLKWHNNYCTGTVYNIRSLLFYFSFFYMSKSSCKIRKEGPLFLQSGLLIKKWKRYNFVLNQANFQYFKLHEVSSWWITYNALLAPCQSLYSNDFVKILKVNETKGQIVVSDILRTEELHNFDTQRASFPFAVHFSGHGSPWILDANTEVHEPLTYIYIHSNSYLRRDAACATSNHYAPDLSMSNPSPPPPPSPYGAESECDIF